MNQEKELEEKLREASCTADEDSLKHLLEKGVDVNSQNSMNGWTALHWASKRSHKTIVAHLLSHGADKNVKTRNGEIPADLATDLSVKRLLGAETNGEIPVKEELPFTPNYLAHPPFPYLSHPVPRPVRNDSPVNLSLGLGTGGGHMPSPIPASQQQYAPDPDELVVKVRVANVAEKDFIEIELDRKRLSFENLMSTMCSELQVNRTLVHKIRKLPDTIVRKDKDVKRLRDFQELELVLSSRSVSESSRNYGPAVSPRHVDVVY